MTYYFVGDHGDSFEDATMHTSPECPDSDVRPLADATVETINANFCDECAGGEGKGASVDEAGLIEQGICPWCDEYRGDYVGQHASSSHPEKWDAYND